MVTDMSDNSKRLASAALNFLKKKNIAIKPAVLEKLEKEIESKGLVCDDSVALDDLLTLWDNDSSQSIKRKLHLVVEEKEAKKAKKAASSSSSEESDSDESDSSSDDGSDSSSEEVKAKPAKSSSSDESSDDDSDSESSDSAEKAKAESSSDSGSADSSSSDSGSSESGSTDSSSDGSDESDSASSEEEEKETSAKPAEPAANGHAQEQQHFVRRLEGSMAHLSSIPIVQKRLRPNQRFLRSVVKSATYANRVAEEKRMWKRREQSDCGGCRSASAKVKPDPTRQGQQDHGGSADRLGKASSSGMDDEDMSAFLGKRKVRGRGSVGSFIAAEKCDEVGGNSQASTDPSLNQDLDSAVAPTKHRKRRKKRKKGNGQDQRMVEV